MGRWVSLVGARNGPKAFPSVDSLNYCHTVYYRTLHGLADSADPMEMVVLVEFIFFNVNNATVACKEEICLAPLWPTFKCTFEPFHMTFDPA